MYFTAKAVNDKTHMFEALSDLVFSYIKVYHADSVWYYMSLLKDVGTLEESHPYLFFLRMRLFAGRVRNNEVETAITEELAFMGKENIGGNDIYIQMEQTFITGYALCSEVNMKRLIPIWKLLISWLVSYHMRKDSSFVFVLYGIFFRP